MKRNKNKNELGIWDKCRGSQHVTLYDVQGLV